jgi:hypothetical protein
VTGPSRSLPLVALALGVAILVVQVRVIAGRKTWDDLRYQTEVAPARVAAAQAVQGGEVPAWWDGSGLGVTLAGEPGHGALYPPHWLAATPRALDLVILAHLAWAALGVAVWARSRASDRGALVAGVLVATTGVLMSAGLRGALPALAHLPWLGVAVGSLGRARSWRERSRAACAIGVLVAAIALVGELAVLLDAIGLALGLGLGKATSRWIGVALAAGLAVGAVQWIPAILQLPEGIAREVSRLPLARLVELLVPGTSGASAAERAIPTLAGEAPWAPSVFIGAPLLALAAVPAPSRRMLGVIGGLAAAALITGRAGCPAWLGAPEIHVAALAIVLAVPAADGIDALVLGQRRAVLALALGVGFTVAALAALAALRAQHRELAPAIDGALVDGALGVVCMVAGLALAWRAPGRRVPVLFALLVAPSVGAAHSLAPTIDRSLVTKLPAWTQRAEVGLAGAEPQAPRTGAVVPCAIHTWQAGEIDLSCTADAASYAVVSSAAASGWQVELDDRDAPWLGVDAMRRAVAIPAGTHRVRWTYVLPGLRAGAVIAIAGALALCALWTLGRRPRTTPRRVDPTPTGLGADRR